MSYQTCPAGNEITILPPRRRLKPVAMVARPASMTAETAVRHGEINLGQAIHKRLAPVQPLSCAVFQ